MKWKFTYMYWFSVCESTLIIEAETETEARKKFDSLFGYEEVDIVNCEKIKA